jgi:hypothetical protein
VDPGPVHDQTDLDDPRPGYPRQLRVRLRAGVPGQGRREGLPAVRRDLVASLLFMAIFAGRRNVPLAGADRLIG